MAREDYYSLLGVDKHAPEREIKRAYYKLARDLHPDKASSPEASRVNAERLAVISKAYNTLKDPKKRAEYDGQAGTGQQRPAADSPTAGGGGAPASPSAPEASASAPATDPAMPPGADSATQRRSPAGPRADPSTGGAKPSPGMSQRDIASQKVLTAQKAFVKGMEYYRIGEHKKALPFFETAVKNDPEGEAQYHMKLAQTLMKTKGSFSRAVQAAEKACELEQYNMDFKIGLGEIYETVGIDSKAEAVYEEVLKWESDNEKAKLRLHVLKDQQKRSKTPNFLAKYFPSLFGNK